MLQLNEDAFYEEVGERIREARLSAGIKQEVFSELLGMTRSSIVNIEKGRQRPSIYLLAIMARILKVDYIDLIPVHLDVQKIIAPQEKDVEIDFNAVVSSSASINDKTKDSLSGFLNQLRK